MTTSHLVLGSAGLLLAIGLVMVFSASSIEAALHDQPVWAPGVQQVVWACLGLGAMLVALHLPIGRIRQWSGRGMLAVLFLLLLVLVPGIGLKLNGARQWFNLGFANFQPSEVGKLVFALWGAHVLAMRERYLTTKTLLMPVLPAFGLMSVLLLLEPDMGAVVSLGLVLAGLLWAGGLRPRLIGGAVVLAALGVVLMVQAAPYRMARVTSFLHPFNDPLGDGMQAVRGIYALARGGFWGVGLGNSAMKWDLLPHAESDYIFAIIGEELGFLGCCVVVSLYGILAWAGFRIARRSADRFVQLASVAITVWIIGQATMNMGYVVGLLPVTGVQLPLISAGGTSLVLTLFIVGLLARFARAEPAAVVHLATQPRNRLAKLLLPAPAAPVDPLPHRRRRTGFRTAAGPRASGRTVTRVAERGRPVRPAAPGTPPERPAPNRVAEQPPRAPRGAPVRRETTGGRQTVGRQATGDRSAVRDGTYQDRAYRAGDGRPVRRSTDVPTSARTAPRTERSDPSDLPAPRTGRSRRG